VSVYGYEEVYIYNKLAIAAAVGLCVGIVLSILPGILARILAVIITMAMTLLYAVELIYYSVFGTFYSPSAVSGVASQAFDFKTSIAIACRNEWAGLTALGVTLVIAIVVCVWPMSTVRHRLVTYMAVVLSAAVLVFGCYLGIYMQRQGDNSPYNLMVSYTSTDMSVMKLGVTETIIRDLIGTGESEDSSAFVILENPEESNSREAVSSGTAGSEATDIVAEGSTAGGDSADAVAGNSDSADDVAGGDSSDDVADGGKSADAGTGRSDGTDSTEISENSTTAVGSATDAIKIYVPNTLDIDFVEVNETAPTAVQNINTYVLNTNPTFQNEYTGMFEGYNLIFIVAEAFDGRFIDKNLTPTLYKMSTEGFVFENYYTPLWYGSTLGGEYANLTGLNPKGSGYLAMQYVADNDIYLPFTLGNQLKSQGYTNYSIHNGYAYYYGRKLSRPCIGYDNWLAVGTGLEYTKNSEGNMSWPQSDLGMVESTFDMYSDSEPFHTYYLTCSGHLEYNFSGNNMARKHKDLVENMEYSETTKAYIACQYELELMLEELETDLEEKGIADNTLIVLTADHVPYDNMEVLDELAGYELEDTFEAYENTLIIYSASMDEPVKVTKPCYSLDVLPTVLNLMNLPYDSRMLVGRDILSDEDGLVIFPDKSFVTDKVKYSSVTGEYETLTGTAVSEEYVQYKKTDVANRLQLGISILESDYYRYVVKDEE